MSSELKILEHERKSIEGQLTRLEQYFDNFQSASDENINQLIARFNRGKKLLGQFEAIQIKIERIDCSNDQRYVHGKFKDHYFNIKPAIETFIKNKTDDNANTSATPAVTNNVSQATNIKLPIINLPSFDGAYENWLNFYETFTSLIHTNTSLPDIQKYHYLRASLKGKAARVIRFLEVSAANYEVALSALKQRFENHRLIIQQHVKALFELQPVTKESATSIRFLSDNLCTHLRPLEALKQPVSQWDTLLIFLVTSKLDPTTRREWETKIATLEAPCMDDLNKFLLTRCQLLESLNTNLQLNRSPQSNQTAGKTRCHLSTQKPLCSYCKQEHAIFKCKSFLALSVTDRISEVRKHKLCINCLRPGHWARMCSSGDCKQCGQKHNTCLHKAEENTSPTPSVTKARITSTTATHHVQQAFPQVLLSTAMVRIQGKNGKSYDCKALLDSGSQSHFITERMCQRLGISRQKVGVPISGINSVAMTVREQAQVKIQSRQGNYQTTLNCLILNRITDQLPPVPIAKERLSIPANIYLADPKFIVPGDVDILIGAALFWNLMCIGQFKPIREQPLVLQKTKLGWIISGPLNKHQGKGGGSRICNLSINPLEAQLQKFWEIEEMSTAKPQYSNKEALCEQHFVDNVKISQDGKFIVKLPLAESRLSLGESQTTAQKRLFQIERKLQRDEQLKIAYHDFMNEYLQMGHMEEVPEKKSTSKRFYLPHHGVIKADSLTTKLRVVFDASAKTSSGLSLNDIMLVGPTIQQDLLAIVLRFRIHKYVLTANIAKMFRQIWMTEEDCDLQTILWRTSSTEPVKTYRLKTVTYGTAAASFLATRCLHEVAELERENAPCAETVIKRDFYMDDFLTGANTVEEATTIKEQIELALSQYGFKLRKWCSNNSQLLQSESEDLIELKTVQIGDGDQIKTLGLGWEPVSDVLRYKSRAKADVKKCTKRNILASIAQVFDPLGLLGPILITAKIIMQQLWQEKLNWDESLPGHLHTAWENYNRQLSYITQVKIARAVVQIDQPDRVDIHGFCDASEAAYGAAIYIRAVNTAGQVSCNLLCARTRVAPLKQVSLPRLELCGALLLTQLYTKVKNASICHQNAHFWTDSTIVLLWLKGTPNQWQTFVANRVAQIQNIADTNQWRHVSTKDNPADLLTRGVSAETLINNKLWWAGPNWLQRPEHEWPNVKLQSTHTPEQRTRIPLAVVPATQRPQLCERFSALTRAQRTLAYCRRFARNCKVSKIERTTGLLSTYELQEALQVFIRLMQNDTYADEMRLLSSNRSIVPTSRLLSLNPFLDKNGLLRVGGRLANAPLSEAQRNPLLLPSNQHLTKLIVQHAHVKQLHGGVQATLAAVRQNYWPINGRSTIRKYIRTCIICFKQRPKVITPQMGQLPAARVTPARPFHNVGVDYAGPIFEGRK